MIDLQQLQVATFAMADGAHYHPSRLAALRTVLSYWRDHACNYTMHVLHHESQTEVAALLRAFPDARSVPQAAEQRPFNPSATRNIALRECGDERGLLLLDADTIPDFHVVSRVMASSGIHVTYNRQLCLSADADYTQPLDRQPITGVRCRENENLGPFCATFIPRHVHQQAGLFDEAFVGHGLQDAEYQNRCIKLGVPLMLCQATAYHVWHEPAPTTYHARNIRLFHQLNALTAQQLRYRHGLLGIPDAFLPNT